MTIRASRTETRRGLRGLAVFVFVGLLALVLGGVARAEELIADQVAASDNAKTFQSGGTKQVLYWVKTGGKECDVDDEARGTTFELVVTAAPANGDLQIATAAGNNWLRFVGCDANPGEDLSGLTYEQPAQFSATVPGTYVVAAFFRNDASNDAASVFDCSTSTSRCDDKATVTINVTAAPTPTDTTAPVITPLVNGNPKADGFVSNWFRGSPDVTWDVVDNESAIASKSGCGPTTVSTDTTGTQFTCTATSAGGTASATITIKRDATAPLVADSTFSRPTDENGWYNAPVDVAFAGSDATSGIATCETVTYNGPDSGTAVAQGTCTDVAGNTSGPGSSAAFQYDATAPTNVVGTFSRQPDSNGWYNHFVQVSFDGQDAVSGIDPATCTNSAANPNRGPYGDEATEPDSATAEVRGRCRDMAGNPSEPTVVAFKYDATKPTIELVERTAANDAGWNNTSVRLAWACADATSGPVATGDGATLANDGADQSATGRCADIAGNSVSDTVGNVDIDTTAPRVACDAAPAGWSRTDVGVACSAADDLSGLKVASSASFSLTAVATPNTETDSAQTDSRDVYDVAGNVATAGPVGGIRIDTMAPAIACTAPSGDPWYGANQTVPCTAADGGAGIAAADASFSLSTGVEAGAESAEAQTAGRTVTDGAGNAAQAGPFTFRVDRKAPEVTPADFVDTTTWHNADVAKDFAATDGGSGLVDAADAGFTLTASDESADATTPTVVSKTVADAVGNTTTRRVVVLIDKTAPTIAAAATVAVGGATPGAYASGAWTNGDVTVAFRCGDSGSGLAAACPTDVVVDADTAAAGLDVSAAIADRAGNRAASNVINVKRDTVAPVISGADVADTAWRNTALAHGFAAGDALAGLAEDGDAAFTLTAAAESTKDVNGDVVPTTVAKTVTDRAGNATTRRLSALIDLTVPTGVAGTPERAADHNGWYNAPVGVTFGGRDALSGIASCTGGTYGGPDSAAASVAGSCTDEAGNTGTGSFALKYDATAPSIGAAADRAPNGHGWYNADVTVGFTCADNLSGIATDACPGPQTLAEGANQSASGTVTDQAGNSASATLGGINVDKTAPTIAGAPTTAANAHGWYKGDVTVRWTVADALSGIESAPADSTITGEGADLGAGPVSVADKAGNSASATVSGVKIDRTAPTLTFAAASPAANAHVWHNTDVSIAFTTADNLSGVALASPTGPLSFSQEGAGQTQAVTVTDLAGNEATFTSSEVSIDKTEPIIVGSRTPLANFAGWTNTDVTVGFDCTDALSQVATVSGPTRLGEGTDQSVTGTCADAAGNTASTTVGGINVDKTAPTGIAFVGGGLIGNASYHFGRVPAAPTGCTADGAISGLASCAVSGYGTGVGAHTVTATATDVAGNVATTTLPYTVLAWTPRGFFQPVDMGTTVYNTVRAGSTVPLRFEVFAGSTELTDATPGAVVTGLKVQQVNPTTGYSVDDIEQLATGGTSLRYDATAGQFVYNWQSPKLAAGTCLKVTVTLADGSTITALFKLK